MSLIYENGAPLTKEDVRDSIEYESPVDGIMLTLTVSILLGLIFVGMWAAIVNSGDEESVSAGWLILSQCAILVLVDFFMIRHFRHTKAAIMKEYEAYRLYSTELCEIELTSTANRYSSWMTLYGKTAFVSENGTVVQKDIKYRLGENKYAESQVHGKTVWVAYNEKTDMLLTFAAELKKLDE